jgi:cobalamin-dependent methionine synthase I
MVWIIELCGQEYVGARYARGLDACPDLLFVIWAM